MHPAWLSTIALGGTLLFSTWTVNAQNRTNGPAPQAAVKPAVAPPAPVLSFDSFKAIPDRNIFNTRRSVRQVEAPVVQRREVIVESFALLGTLDYPKGSVAFFEGSSASFRKAVKVDESIGGCKVTAIEPALVKLEANGKPVDLPIGYMLRREDDGDWKLREAERPTDFGSPVSSTPSFGSTFGSMSSSRDSRFGSSSSGRDSRSSSFNSRSPFGNETPADSAQRRIRDQDKNGDGKISRDEADSRLRQNFDLMDRNRDGFVDAEEYTAYYASRMGGGSVTPGSSFNTGNSSTSGGTFSSGASSNASSPGTSGTPAAGTTSSPGGTSESDLLRRLMEQRARENR